MLGSDVIIHYDIISKVHLKHGVTAYSNIEVEQITMYNFPLLIKNKVMVVYRIYTIYKAN